MLHFGLLTKKSILSLAIKNKLLYDSIAATHTLQSIGDASYSTIYSIVNDNSGFWYDSSGNPVTRTISEILSDGQTNQWLIWCNNSGRLMIFNNTLTDAEVVKIGMYMGLGSEELPPEEYSWIIFNGRRISFNGSYELAKICA